MTLAVLRDVVARLNLSAGALIGLGLALDARTCGKPIEPTLQPRLDAVLDALGVRQLIEGLSPADPGSEPLAGTWIRLRTAIWGGLITVPAEAERLLAQAGFVDLQTLPSPLSATAIMVVGRRS
jgi:hypothetical protein